MAMMGLLPFFANISTEPLCRSRRPYVYSCLHNLILLTFYISFIRYSTLVDMFSLFFFNKENHILAMLSLKFKKWLNFEFHVRRESSLNLEYANCTSNVLIITTQIQLLFFNFLCLQEMHFYRVRII